MKTALFNTLLVATLVITSSCNSSNSGSSSNSKSGGGSSGTSQLTESQIKEYGATVSEMLKTSMTSLTITKDGCVMQTKELNVDLTENNNQKIEFKKTISSSSSKECNGQKFVEENQVEVGLDDEPEECKLTGTKTGDILEVKSSCDNAVSIVDLKAKTLKTSTPTSNVFIQAVTLERKELLGYLANVKIIRYKKNANNSVSIGSTEVGNANTILNLGL